MQVDVVRDADGLAALAADWTRLDRTDPRAEFYTTHACVQAWWAAFGEDAAYDLHVLVARHNGAVAGILPLARQRISVRKESRTMLRFASHGDWMGLVCDPALDPRTVCRVLLARIDADDSWDLLSLDNLRATSALAAYALGSDRWNPHLAHRVEHPRIDLVGVESLAAFEAAGRVPAKTRKYRARLLRDHDVRFVVREGDEGDLLARLGRLHALEKDHLVREQGRRERHSWFEDPLRRGHYAGLFAAPGLAVTFGYEGPDGELLAARSTFRHGRTLLSWTSTYHPDLRDYRLGKVIQYDILDHVLRHGGVDVFDFGAGRYPWKFEWTTAFESSYRLRLERPSRGSSVSGSAVSRRDGPGCAVPESAATTRTHEPASERGPAQVGLNEGLGRRIGRGVGRRVGRMRTTIAQRLSREEIWYLARPGDELTVWGALLERGSLAHVHLVHLGPWATTRQRRMLDAELKDPITDEALAQAIRDELIAAGEAIGIPPGNVHALPHLAPSGWARRVAVREALAAYPHATHRIAVGGPTTDLVRAEADRVGVRVVEVTPAAATPTGRRAQAVIAAYRLWDPDSGRYAVHRTPASRFLAESAGPQD